jgi:hypothetical protein
MLAERASLPLRLLACLLVYLLVYLLVCLLAWLLGCLLVCLFARLLACLLVCLFARLLVCLLAWLLACSLVNLLASEPNPTARSTVRPTLQRKPTHLGAPPRGKSSGLHVQNTPYAPQQQPTAASTRAKATATILRAPCTEATIALPRVQLKGHGDAQEGPGSGKGSGAKPAASASRASLPQLERCD